MKINFSIKTLLLIPILLLSIACSDDNNDSYFLHATINGRSIPEHNPRVVIRGGNMQIISSDVTGLTERLIIFLKGNANGTFGGQTFNIPNLGQGLGNPNNHFVQFETNYGSQSFYVYRGTSGSVTITEQTDESVSGNFNVTMQKGSDSQTMKGNFRLPIGK